MTEAVLLGTICMYSKIRSQSVHYHDSFWRDQNLGRTKLILSLSGIDFALSVSRGAVRISSRAIRYFSSPITWTRSALTRELFTYGFPRKLRAGPYGSYDNKAY